MALDQLYAFVFDVHSDLCSRWNRLHAHRLWSKPNIHPNGIPVLFQGNAYGALILWRRLIECDK